MPPRQLPLFILEQVASHLPVSGIVRFGAMSKHMHSIATKLCNLLAEAVYKGIHPSGMCNKRPDWMRLKIATLPRLLISGESDSWPELTKAFPFTLDTKGPLFLEFRMVIAKARNGSPRIGVLNAESSSWVIPDSCRDFSRGRGDIAFSISMSPSTGEVLATVIEGGSETLTGLPTSSRPSRGSPRHEVYNAKLKWPEEVKEHANWNHPIRAGLFLKDGGLSFWRLFKDGHWHSSGVICRDLPRSVLPCVFMSDFLGYVRITFDRILNVEPGTCGPYYCRYQGTVDGWHCFPSY